MVAQYCAGCHSDRGKAGGLSLRGGRRRPRGAARETTEKMIRKLRAGMMPPPGARRPEPAQLAAAGRVRSKRAWTRLPPRSPDPGWRPVPAAEPRRVRARGQADGRARRGRHRVPAGRHDQQRLRQRRRRADVLADADGGLPARGQPHRDARGGRSRQLARVRPPSSCRRPRRSSSAPTVRRSARAAACRSSTPSRADGDYVFSMEFFAEPLGLLYGSTAANEQIEIVARRCRVALFDINPRMSEEKTGLTIKTAPLHVTRGHAPRDGRVHPAVSRGSSTI